MNWLEELCMDHNVTRYQLSKATGISQSYLSKIIKEDISFFDIKVSQYLSIVDYFCIRADTPSVIHPAYEFKKMYDIFSRFKNLHSQHLDKEISMDIFFEESTMLLSQLQGSFEAILEQPDVAGIYVCKKKSYLNAIKKIDSLN